LNGRKIACRRRRRQEADIGISFAAKNEASLPPKAVKTILLCGEAHLLRTAGFTILTILLEFGETRAGSHFSDLRFCRFIRNAGGVLAFIDATIFAKKSP